MDAKEFDICASYNIAEAEGSIGCGNVGGNGQPIDDRGEVCCHKKNIGRGRAGGASECEPFVVIKACRANGGLGRQHGNGGDLNRGRTQAVGIGGLS